MPDTPVSPTLGAATATLTIEDVIFANQEKHRQRLDKDLIHKDDSVISCIRSLAMDAVQEANSGHPGTPMAMAPVAYSLWAKILMYDPMDPRWPNRDRFVLSMGHASMLLYGLLHVAGVREGKDAPDLAVPLEDIKQFRQLGSKCPGHPEYGMTAGVEMTTGPLGQGVATSVGMAIASKWQKVKFNKPGFELFNYNVYALCGDGCLQEGVSAEAASLAGHLKLDNLCWIWDNNRITIEGNTAWAISEDIATRFIAYGWNVLRVGDANNVESLTRAFLGFQRERERPTLIVVDSHIAWGAPTKQDCFTAHGTPLGEEEVKATKRILGWPEEKFLVPADVAEHFHTQMISRGGISRMAWDNKLQEYKKLHWHDFQTLECMLKGDLPEGWDRFLKEFPASPKGMATRQSSGEVINAVAQGIPWLLGGSADLGPSCLTTLKFEGASDFMPPGSSWGSYGGRNFHFGIREHAMGSIMNGMALCNLRPFGSTFLVFSDYMRPPIRISAIMEVPSIWIFTHDSIGVGEDGPTHQPVEQLGALRIMPGLYTFRPCDANEVLEMWRFIVTLKRDPVAVVLSRQGVPTLDRTKYRAASGISHGAYILADTGAKGDRDASPDIILMASGSEVSLMLLAHEALEAEGKKVRSVSAPCLELFKHQKQEYIDSVLPPSCRARVSIEAGRRAPWDVFIGLDGEHVGMITFGVSGTNKDVMTALGFTKDAVVKAANRVIEGKPRQIEDRANVHRNWKRQRVIW
jgi:transketolase